MPEAQSTVEAFFDLFMKGQIVFFAGSGICFDSEMPSAKHILDKTASCVLPSVGTDEKQYILDRIQPEVFYERLLSVADQRQHSNALLLWSILSKTTQQQYGFCLKPNIVHRLIVQNAVEHGNPIFTTNFDTLFEDACGEQGCIFDQPRLAPKDCPPPDDGIFRIVKLHGSIAEQSSMLLTMTNITRLNLPWLEFMKRSVETKRLCVVGYSGRDLDIFPTIEKIGRDTRGKVIWINRFSKDCYSDSASRTCKALRIDRYPSEIFREFAPNLHDAAVPQTTRDMVQSALNHLAQRMARELAFSKDAKELMRGVLLAAVGSNAVANQVLEEAFANRDSALTDRQRAKLLLATMRSRHATAQFTDCLRLARSIKRWCGRLSEDWARNTYVQALSFEAQALGMHVPGYTYFCENRWTLRLPRLVMLTTEFALLLRMGVRILLTPGQRRYSTGTKHELLEARIRVVAYTQDLLVTRNGPFVLKILFTRAWDWLRDRCEREGYAAGIANCYKFRSRIDETARLPDKQRAVHGLITDLEGAVLAYRNEADLAKTTGKFRCAEKLYRIMRDKAKEAGVILSQIKALLGIADTRRQSGVCGPLLDPDEIKEFDQLAPRVQGRLWKRHLALVRKVLTGEVIEKSGGLFQQLRRKR